MTAAATQQTDNRKPDPGGRIAGALKRYRVLAWITGVWLLVLTVEMIYKYLILENSSDSGPVVLRETCCSAASKPRPDSTLMVRRWIASGRSFVICSDLSWVRWYR